MRATPISVMGREGQTAGALPQGPGGQALREFRGPPRIGKRASTDAHGAQAGATRRDVTPSAAAWSGGTGLATGSSSSSNKTPLGRKHRASRAEAEGDNHGGHGHREAHGAEAPEEDEVAEEEEERRAPCGHGTAKHRAAHGLQR
eukprot:CAMPEP_0176302162 /NCGR_PEP_ID=MMETSP0121_2-20121125/61238_1 /TAXON_ID=160619 /ORGANISM="Kryptoperidinium foliaceum, Strain CCMP 1326" /LENGTH=144 /DNA_ID=CAMNT_0017643659 /DNA_START=192 /DNA_END=623 /DNA_ORIENTATION=-